MRRIGEKWIKSPKKAKRDYIETLSECLIQEGIPNIMADETLSLELKRKELQVLAETEAFLRTLNAQLDSMEMSMIDIKRRLKDLTGKEVIEKEDNNA